MNVVVSQALATGLPVITTRHSGLPEQVIDGRNGFLVDEGDYRALADRILEISAHPEPLPTMSVQSRQHVEEHYNSGMLIMRQIEIYKRAIAESLP